MPTKPTVKTLSASAPQIINAIRNDASINYKNYVPYATPDAESIRAIGAVIMDNTALKNEFLNALINRIGRVVVTSKLYSNPWAVFKRGKLEFGETIEEIFVNLAKPFQYNPETAETNVWKREIPDVRAAFHTLNFKKFYKDTIENDNLRTAFLSWDGITDLIARIVDSMYTGAAYDEFQTMKYMLARHILNGMIKVVEIPAVSKENASDIMVDVMKTSNKFTYMNGDWNLAGVKTHTPKEDQYVILSSDFEPVMNVEVLAMSFNMDKATLSGHLIQVDSFGALDTERLGELFAGDPNYQEIGADDLALLDSVPAVMVDRDWFAVWDNFENFTELYNGEGLYWQYWYHTWKTFSVSPFSQAAVFNPVKPAVTGVTVSPKAVTIGAGQSAQLTASVQTTGFAPQTVTWESNNDGATVTADGVVTIKAGTAASTQITITAKSVFDPSKTDTCTVTTA